ncbi:E3 ubiquitin-protein ligase COP1-like [Macaca fascicularis]|uniref:E3 ubiquitin-protein ligase COP1-like n=1 Tax=Macaca fascicularis TaxID=9541 RepID=UPI0032B046C1
MEVEKSGPGIAECTVPSESEGLKARKRGASPIRVSVRKLGEPLVRFLKLLEAKNAEQEGASKYDLKLWYTNLDSSVASTEAKANVCCVKFSPSFRYHLAFGCADHCVHYYDLHNTEQPIIVFKGHQKAVSYAKFVSGEEMVFASTDSQLKLWNVGKSYSPCSFKGHINEKNFVDLASNGDYKACRSENSSLYLYYKGLSKTLLTFKFDAVKSVLDKDQKGDDTKEFVSTVCWRALPDGDSNVLIAANSQGTIKVLELV